MKQTKDIIDNFIKTKEFRQTSSLLSAGLGLSQISSFFICGAVTILEDNGLYNREIKHELNRITACNRRFCTFLTDMLMDNNTIDGFNKAVDANVYAVAQALSIDDIFVDIYPSYDPNKFIDKTCDLETIKNVRTELPAFYHEAIKELARKSDTTVVKLAASMIIDALNVHIVAAGLQLEQKAANK